MDIKEPMGLPTGVVSGSSTNTIHPGNLEASRAGTNDSTTRADATKMATSAARDKPVTNVVVTPVATMALPNSSSLNNPSTPYMSTAIVPLSLASPVTGPGFSFANTGPGLGFTGFESMKKKRGRPRKYGSEASLALSVAPLLALAPSSLSPSQKRGRGRPPGSGKNQRLAALGELMLGSVGVGFTPHAITIGAGEDIAARIMTFSQQGPRGICILSANGAVSSVTLRQTSLSGGIVTYEGRFEILSLSGSFLLTDFGGAHSRTGGLSVSLAGPDGRIVGGAVAGVLIAASPVQVIVGSFLCNTKKLHPKPTKTSEGPTDGSKRCTLNTDNSTCPDVQMNQKSDDDKPATGAVSPTPDKSTEGAAGSSNTESPPQGQAIPAQSSAVGWPASQITTEAKHFTNNDISLQG